MFSWGNDYSQPNPVSSIWLFSLITTSSADEFHSALATVQLQKLLSIFLKGLFWLLMLLYFLLPFACKFSGPITASLPSLETIPLTVFFPLPSFTEASKHRWRGGFNKERENWNSLSEDLLDGLKKNPLNEKVNSDSPHRFYCCCLLFVCLLL